MRRTTNSRIRKRYSTIYRKKRIRRAEWRIQAGRCLQSSVDIPILLNLRLARGRERRSTPAKVKGVKNRVTTLREVAEEARVPRPDKEEELRLFVDLHLLFGYARR